MPGHGPGDRATGRLRSTVERSQEALREERPCPSQPRSIGSAIGRRLTYANVISTARRCSSRSAPGRRTPRTRSSPTDIVDGEVEDRRPGRELPVDAPARSATADVRVADLGADAVTTRRGAGRDADGSPTWLRVRRRGRTAACGRWAVPTVLTSPLTAADLGRQLGRRRRRSPTTPSTPGEIARRLVARGRPRLRGRSGPSEVERRLRWRRATWTRLGRHVGGGATTR